MVLGKCACVATCEDPTGKHDYHNNCTEEKSCICPEGLLLKDDHCVHPSECGCFLPESGKVLGNNEFFMFPGCSRRCVCKNKELICDNDYQCSLDTTCEERNHSHQCYCKDGVGGDPHNLTLPTDCLDIFNTGSNESGIYTIKPTTWLGQPFEVYCNMDNGGGWAVFQRRVNGSVEFYTKWEDYKQGFGFLDHEFWLGNEKLFRVTNQADYELRIDVANFLGDANYATYGLFRIADKDHKYRLTELGTFGGTAGIKESGLSSETEVMKSYRAFYFTTRDSENDDYNSGNCAHLWRGGWWFSRCFNANLNGDYSIGFPRRFAWQFTSDEKYKTKYTEMKIRPIEGSTCKKTK
ncbi:Fibrinogen C domain-containing protein 1 [Holothuria leucospilota]|uniref:Fibrinogen C domain-containing protein 1 n=1 Tax=Holothuria leucospilota TaxID=206669 RepID=A0A9Q1BUX5_HOLLE|nr:Fibrinogen C domain-containing protein 1 [Holothuria leucospilota]